MDIAFEKARMEVSDAPTRKKIAAELGCRVFVEGKKLTYLGEGDDSTKVVAGQTFEKGKSVQADSASVAARCVVLPCFKVG